MTLDLSKPISAAMLAEAGACPDAVEWVRQTHGDEPVTLTRARLIEAAAVVNVRWLSRFLPDEAWPAFREAADKADAAHREAIEKALATYHEDYRADAFDKATAHARAAYEEAIAPAWAAYNKAIDTARAAYAKARAHALADAMRLP